MFSENEKKYFSLSIHPSLFWPVCASKPEAEVRYHPLIFFPSVRAAVLMAQLSPTTRSLERLPGLFCISSFQPTPARIREPGPATGPREAHLGSTLMARSPGHHRRPSSASVPCTPRGPRVPRPLKLRAP
jgi:hypothetical protein